MQNARNRDGSLKYPAHADLFFHYTNQAPEKMMVSKYLANHPDGTLQWHVDNSSPHILLEKMRELGLAASKEDALNICVSEYVNSVDGRAHFETLKSFLQRKCQI